jgi:hypothetical protein
VRGWILHKTARSLLIVIILLSLIAASSLGSFLVYASPTEYYPSSYNLLGQTSYVSGAVGDLVSDNGAYMTFRSYPTPTPQPLYAHGETTTISGTPYYQLKLTSAEAAAVDHSASTAATGRVLWDKHVYSLAGMSIIPNSTWSFYYRTWHSTASATTTTLRPNQAGTYQQWSTFGIGMHYALTSDQSDATGVQITGDETSKETERLADPTFGDTATINFVNVYVRVQVLSGAGGGEAGVIILRTNNVDYETGAINFKPARDTWLNFNNVWATNPYTASAWTKTEVANLQAGIRASSLGSGETVQCSEIWIVVDYTPAPSAHADADILIRKSDGTVRTTIATNVSDSGAITDTAQTLSGTYVWSNYTVVSATDYLEIDYYVHVTYAVAGLTAYLRVDDSLLAVADQTRITNIRLPGSPSVLEVEFTGTSDTYFWVNLTWTVDSQWTTGSVTVTLQLYNYTASSYAASGDGYISYTSSGTPNTDETKTQTAASNANSFKTAAGTWKLKIKGTKATTTQFDLKVDLTKIDQVPRYLSVDPATTTITSLPATFSIDINITNAEDLYGWEFKLTYNKTLLTATKAAEGTFLNASGGKSSFFSVIQLNDSYTGTLGLVWATATLIGDIAPTTGDGTLATVDFSVDTSPGSSALNLYNSYLVGYNYTGDKTTFFISHGDVDGTVTVTGAVVPEFPFGAALEIGLVVAIVYVVLRKRRKEPRNILQSTPVIP